MSYPQGVDNVPEVLDEVRCPFTTSCFAAPESKIITVFGLNHARM